MSRKRMLGAIVTVVLMGGAVAPAARAVEVTALEYAVPTDGVTDAAYLRFEVPSRMLAVWSDLDYAAVEFESSLEPGNEVELYPGTSADVLPWTLRTPPERVLWVAGARTGDCVRFDLTPLVRAHGQEEQALVLFIRRAPDAEGEVAGLSVDESPGLTLTVHAGTD